jgi:hypothetical protein
MLLDMPEYDLLVKNLCEDELEVAERFWKALWMSYIRNKGTTSSIYWLEQFKCPIAFNKCVIIWKDYVSIVTIPARNWSEVSLNEDKLLTLFTETELIEFRRNSKMVKYLPEFKETYKSNLVKVHGKVQKTGLKRQGFAMAANTQFYYDTRTLEKYRDAVVQETVKGMSKMRERYPEIEVDDASYDVISEAVVDQIIAEPEIYSLGTSYIDSRGRAIKECLSKVANPIGFKCFRSLLTIPQ